MLALGDGDADARAVPVWCRVMPVLIPVALQCQLMPVPGDDAGYCRCLSSLPQCGAAAAARCRRCRADPHGLRSVPVPVPGVVPVSGGAPAGCGRCRPRRIKGPHGPGWAHSGGGSRSERRHRHHHGESRFLLLLPGPADTGSGRPRLRGAARPAAAAAPGAWSRHRLHRDRGKPGAPGGCRARGAVGPEGNRRLPWGCCRRRGCLWGWFCALPVPPARCRATPCRSAVPAARTARAARTAASHPVPGRGPGTDTLAAGARGDCVRAEPFSLSTPWGWVHDVPVPFPVLHLGCRL